MATKKNETLPEEQVGLAEDAMNGTPNVGEEQIEKPVARKRAAPKAPAAKSADGEEVKPKSRKAAAKPAVDADGVSGDAQPASAGTTRKKEKVSKSAAAKEPAEVAASEESATEPVAESASAPAVEPASEKTPEPVGEASVPEPEATPEASAESALTEQASSGEDSEEKAEEKEEGAKHAVDYSDKTKEELVSILGELLATRPVQTLRSDTDAIKIAFYKLHRPEVDALRTAFIEAGGQEEEFAAPVDLSEQRLKDMLQEYRRKRDEYAADIEKHKEDNLRTKQQLIEELKELLNGTETLNATFHAFRSIQQRWRETGPVPQGYVKDLWETYNLHIEHFYNYIKINKELRDLDLKRNHETKIQLCEEAEALILEPSIVNAFHKLQKLHEQWRETGPVADEYKEVLWDRFREASSRINKHHQSHFEEIKEEQKRNLDLKTELCVKAEELSAAGLSSHKEWNKASDQLVELQKVWKTIGYAPKKDNNRVYDRFRAACDVFFAQKREFYQQAKSEMEMNLQQKIQLCEMAEALQDSSDWKKATDELIELQKQWKVIGPVARRHSDSLWKRFRTACDAFFTRKQEHFSTVDTEYDENLRRKEALLVEIDAFDIGEGGFEAIKEFQRRWGEIGFVPIKQKDAIQKRYKESMDRLFGALRGTEHDRQMDRFKGRISGMKNTGDKRLRFERDRLYNKVKQLESDIATLENNIGFFGRSKNADAMIAEVNRKIEAAKVEMAATIEKIGLIDRQE